MEALLKKLEEQASLFAQYREANDNRLKKLEEGKTGSYDEAKVAKVEKDLGAIATEIQELTAKMQRGEIGQVLVDKDGRPLRSKTADEVEYEKAFGDYLRKGVNYGDVVKRLGDLGLKTMQVSSDPDGGYWVSPDLSGRLVQKIFETSEMRRIASVTGISTDALEGPIDNQEAGAGWTSETGARPATSTPQTGKWRIPVHEMYAMPEATQQLLDDAAVNVEAWLQNKVTEKMVRLENAAFITGNGIGKPRGIADYATAATGDSTRAWGTVEHVATGTSGGFGASPAGSDKLIDFVMKLKPGYRQGAQWVMNRATLAEVRKLKTTDGTYIWLPSMVAGQNSLLLGYPVVEMEDVASIGANSLSIAFGNFKEAYQIVDRQGFRVLRDPFTNKPYVRFYTTRRVGGGLLNSEAFKWLKFSVA